MSTINRLVRPGTDAKIAGVCAGLGNYLGVDPTFIRVIWVVLSVIPGCLIGGVLAYALAWIVIPRDPTAVPWPTSARRLHRSSTDSKIAGVCGGIGEFVQVDPTVVRMIWILLSVVPGLIIGGILGYVVAWLIMPSPTPLVPQPDAVHTT